MVDIEWTMIKEHLDIPSSAAWNVKMHGHDHAPLLSPLLHIYFDWVPTT